MLCSGTLHHHDNPWNNTDKREKPDVTGCCCLDIHFMTFLSQRWGGRFSFHVSLHPICGSHTNVWSCLVSAGGGNLLGGAYFCPDCGEGSRKGCH